MTKLKDFIDLLNNVGDISMCVYTEDSKIFKYIEDDITDELSHTVKSINIYGDIIEICIGD